MWTAYMPKTDSFDLVHLEGQRSHIFIIKLHNCKICYLYTFFKRKQNENLKVSICCLSILIRQADPI